MNYKFLFVTFASSALLFLGCNEAWGDHSLGNHLSMLDGDKKEDRIIVFCMNESGICDGGIQLIPTYERHMDSINHRYLEYVEDAVSDKEWVAVRSFVIAEKRKNYWLINKTFKLKPSDCIEQTCDSILQKYITGPLDLKEFSEKKKVLNINLEFSN